MNSFQNTLVATDTHPIADKTAHNAQRNGATLQHLDVVPEFPWTASVMVKQHEELGQMATHTVTINPAFLQEIKEDDEQLRLLLAEARELSESPLLTELPAHRFASLLAELRDQLAMHFTLEEAYGYFDDPVSVAPHLSERVESLRKQHDQLYEEMSRLAESAQDTAHRDDDPQVIRHLARRFMNFLDRLEDHEADENELIMRAYTLDIGGSG